MKFFFSALILAAALFPVASTAAGTGSTTNSAATLQGVGERIVFLHLRRGPEGVTLLHTTVRPGRLKALPSNGAFQFEVINDAGTVLQSGAMRDPASKRLEYEDPEHPGQLIAREVNAGTAEFTIRVSGNSTARAVRFYLKKPAAPGKVTAQANREFLGEVALSSKTETP